MVKLEEICEWSAGKETYVNSSMGWLVLLCRFTAWELADELHEVGGYRSIDGKLRAQVHIETVIFFVSAKRYPEEAMIVILLLYVGFETDGDMLLFIISNACDFRNWRFSMNNLV